MKIESIQNKKIKERTKLHTKKERDKTGLFIIEGYHLVEEAYKANQLEELYILDGLESTFDIPTYECTQSVINKLSNQISNSKIIGVCKKKQNDESIYSKVLFLDEVQDPGNVGTIIRSAYSFGIDCIYLSHNCADVYNLKTIQATQGALFHIPVYTCDLEEKIKLYQDNHIPVYATALHSKSKFLQEIDVPSKYGIVLGNEGQGIKPSIIDQCNECIKIEMEAFESLNVAIAASICIYQFQYKK